MSDAILTVKALNLSPEIRWMIEASYKMGNDHIMRRWPYACSVVFSDWPLRETVLLEQGAIMSKLAP